MASITSRLSATFAVIGAIILVVVSAATAAWAIESEGEMFSRDRLVGNLGVAHAEVGVYPDRTEANPVPEITTGSDVLTIPEGVEIVDALVYWAGRGPDWSDDEIIVNGTTITPDTDYFWDGKPSWKQTTYVADLDEAGLTFTTGQNQIDISGMDHNGGRFYGAGVVVIYDDPSLPEVELELLEGNEFAFFDATYFDDVGNAAEHTATECIEYSPAIEDRSIHSFSRIMGVDAGRGDGPPRTQRLQWWTGTTDIVAPVVDGRVGIPDIAAQGSVDNPVPARVAPTAEWGSEVFVTDDPVLLAGQTHFCTQLQSVSIGDGAGASMALTNQGGTAATVHRIGNLVWLDSNEDGMADAGEPGIDGVTVELIKVGSDTPLATTVTSDDGEYVFDGLLCGTYKVVIPGSQSGWTVGGEAVDAAAIMPGMINNPDANDDNDNDNNGVTSGDMVMSGEVEIGDCGEDGDFSNTASNEPTNEVDRKGGPDDDPDEVAIADGNYDDVRSNVSVDFSFVEHDCVADEDGVFPADAVNADGEPCDTCDTADPGPDAVDADGELCNPCDSADAAADAVDADGEPCNPCNVTNPAPGAVDADGELCNPCDSADAAADAVDADGEPCNPCNVTNPAPGAVDAEGELCNPCDSADAAADAVDADGEPCNPCKAINPSPAAVDADGEPCNPCDAADAGPGAVDNDLVPCTPCADADAAQTGVNADGTPCNPCHDDAGADAVDADGEPCNPCNAADPAADAVDADGEPCDDPVDVEVEGLVECPGDTDRAGVEVAPGESCNNVCDEDGNVTAADTPGATNANCQETQLPVSVEVEGQVETNPDVPGQTDSEGDDGDQAQVPGDNAVDQAVAQPSPDLAVTGSWSTLVMLAAMMLLVLGAWFYVAALWMRPAGSYEN